LFFPATTYALRQSAMLLLPHSLQQGELDNTHIFCAVCKSPECSDVGEWEELGGAWLEV